ncbi:MAG: T9SS type A sorting domain-containing protein [Saprospiraceae bacterium]
MRTQFFWSITIFFMVTSFGLKAQTCEADFFGTNQSNHTIEFHNISAGQYTNASWDFGNGITFNALSSLTYTFANSGTFSVCLTVSNSFGCSSTTCHDITIDGSGEYLDSTCYYTDCVFPGDVNYDNIVNAYDVLPIALHNGTFGKARPNASSDFVGQASANWKIQTSNNVDFKHADADGNGVVDLNDLAVIQQNFMFEHDGIVQKSAEGTPLWVQFDPIVYPTNPNDPFVISAGIMIGTTNDPVNDLLGIAFLLDYDESIVDAGSVNVTYHNASIIGQNNTAATLAIDNAFTGDIAMANARTDQSYVTGFSRLATVDFTITDIVIGLQSSIKFDLNPYAIQAIDTLGQPIPITGQEGSVTFSTTATESISNYQNISLYPNPVESILTLELGNVYGEYIEIFNSIGHKIQEQTLNQRGTIQVSVDNISTGWYLFKVQTENGSAVKRIYIK